MARILGVGPDPQRRQPIVGVADVGPQAVEVLDVEIQARLAVLDRLAQHGLALVVLARFLLPRRRARFELLDHVLLPRDLGEQRGGPLDESRVRGACVGDATADDLGGFAGVLELALRDGEPLVGGQAHVFLAGDRLARLALATLERPPLLLRTGALGRQDLRLPGEALPILERVRHQRLEADDRLLLRVRLPDEPGDLLRQAIDGRCRLAGPPLQPKEGGTNRDGAVAKLLDLALRGENAAGLLAHAAVDLVRTAEHVAVGRHHGQVRQPRGLGGAGVGSRNPGVADGVADEAGVRARDADHRRHRHQAFDRRRGRRRGRGRRGADDEEAAAAGVVLAHEREAARRLVVVGHEHVLQQVAEVRLDGALVSAVDLEAVGQRSELADARRLVGQQEPRGVAVLRAGGFELLERRQPRLHAGQLLLAGAGVLAKLLVLVPGVGQLRLAGLTLGAHPLEPHLGSRQLLAAGLEIGLQAPVLDVDVRPFGARAWPAPPRRARARRTRCRWRAGAS